jgi:N-acetylglucosaminyldiphosphoundecaprenol N-acetyl-beta-D-mannosaminyltransferase
VIADWIERGQRQYVCVANVHSVMESRRDAAVGRAYEGAGLVVPDGMPLVWLGRWQGHPDVGRCYGPDLLMAFCALAEERGYASYFYGGAPGVADELGAVLSARFPRLRVVGAIAPAFPPTPAEIEASVARINAARPDVVWIGLGCPRQELWMAAQRERLQAPVLVGIGAAFDFHTGRVRQAPRWMMRSGLEWLFRLGAEPRRLWYRYLVYNPWFVALLLRQGAARLLSRR